MPYWLHRNFFGESPSSRVPGRHLRRASAETTSLSPWLRSGLHLPVRIPESNRARCPGSVFVVEQPRNEQANQERFRAKVRGHHGNTREGREHELSEHETAKPRPDPFARIARRLALNSGGPNQVVPTGSPGEPFEE